MKQVKSTFGFLALLTYRSIVSNLTFAPDVNHRPADVEQYFKSESSEVDSMYDAVMKKGDSFTTAKVTVFPFGIGENVDCDSTRLKCTSKTQYNILKTKASSCRPIIEDEDFRPRPVDQDTFNRMSLLLNKHDVSDDGSISYRKYEEPSSLHHLLQCDNKFESADAILSFVMERELPPDLVITENGRKFIWSFSLPMT